MNASYIQWLIAAGHLGTALSMLGENLEIPEIASYVESIKTKMNALNAARCEPIDPRFYELMESIASCTESEIFERILKTFNNAPHDYRCKLVQNRTEFLSLGFMGKLDPTNNVYDDFHMRAKILKAHRDDLIWLHKRLVDNRSKNTLYAVLANWADNDTTALNMYKEQVFMQYFDIDIFPWRENEVLADLGAAAGDTVREFVCYSLGQHKRIYSYEITPETFERLQDNLKSYPNVVLRQKGAWSSSGFMYLAKGPGPAANQVRDGGDIKIETVRIDDDIPEPVTFIKMDIEGAERQALIGCTRQIRENKPRLAICTYHGYEDIYAIPRLVDEISPGYKFFMRYHDHGCVAAQEFTLLAV